MSLEHIAEADEKIRLLRSRSITEFGTSISYGRIAEVVAQMIHEREEKMIREHLSYMSGAKLRAVRDFVHDGAQSQVKSEVAVRVAEIDREIERKTQNAQKKPRKAA